MFEEILSPLFTTGWGKRSSIGALVLTTSMLFYVLINISLTAYRQFNLNSPSITPTAITHTDLTQLIVAVPQWHLFGGGVDDVLPLTNLQIHLTGIIGHSGDASRAIISEGDKRGKIYRVGDVLESGVHIYAITIDSVVLENGGQLEKLPLRVRHSENDSSTIDTESNNLSENRRED